MATNNEEKKIYDLMDQVFIAHVIITQVVLSLDPQTKQRLRQNLESWEVSQSDIERAVLSPAQIAKARKWIDLFLEQAL